MSLTCVTHLCHDKVVTSISSPLAHRPSSLIPFFSYATSSSSSSSSSAIHRPYQAHSAFPHSLDTPIINQPQQRWAPGATVCSNPTPTLTWRMTSPIKPAVSQMTQTSPSCIPRSVAKSSTSSTPASSTSYWKSSKPRIGSTASSTSALCPCSWESRSSMKICWC